MSALSKILIALIFVAAGAGVYVMQMDTGAAVAQQAVNVNVRVAAAPLQVGTFLDDAKAPFQSMPENEVGEDWVTDAGRGMLGAVIIAPVEPGQPVRRGDLLAPGQEGFLAAVLRPGFRAISLPVDAVSGNAGHIFPGDRVDLLLTQEIEDAGDNSGRRWASETILRDVRVIAVDQRLGADLANRASAAGEELSVARTITLEVRPGGAETIAVARNLGAISLTLRSLIVEGAPGEDEAPEPPVWARDVSAVTRATSATPQPPSPTVAPPAPVVVMRGEATSEIAQ